MKILSHAIEIDASPEATWSAVTDLAAYGEWNPFLVAASGDLRPGSRLTLTMKPGKRTMTFRPTVLAHEPGQRLTWRGRLGLPRLFDGEHELRVEPRDGGRSRFVQQERFSGILVPFLGTLLRDTEAGFEQMNRALKRRLEAGATA
jgi:hypothetical protein